MAFGDDRAAVLADQVSPADRVAALLVVSLWSTGWAREHFERFGMLSVHRVLPLLPAVTPLMFPSSHLSGAASFKQ
jgi:hypothetical protein